MRAPQNSTENIHSFGSRKSLYALWHRPYAASCLEPALATPKLISAPRVHALNLTSSDRIAYWRCNIPIKVGSQDELGCRLGETDNPDRVGAMPAHAPAIPCADL